MAKVSEKYVQSFSPYPPTHALDKNKNKPKINVEVVIFNIGRKTSFSDQLKLIALHVSFLLLHCLFFTFTLPFSSRFYLYYLFILSPHKYY